MFWSRMQKSEQKFGLKDHGMFAVKCKGLGGGGVCTRLRRMENLCQGQILTFFYLGAAWQSNIFTPIG